MPRISKTPGSRTSIPAASITDLTVSKMEGILNKRQLDKCIGPKTVFKRMDTPSLFRIIDEQIWRIMVLKPQMFNRLGGVAPRIYPNYLRGYFYNAFLYYAWKYGGLEGTYNFSTSIGSLKIPMSLAKIFQYFAPYCDIATGSTYITTIPITNPDVLTNWNSIDQMTSSGLNVTALYDSPSLNLNAPNKRYLISASDKAGSYLEYCACVGVEARTGVTITTAAWSTVSVQPSYLDMTRIFQTVLPGMVTVDEIPLYSPDGSAYTSMYKNGITSPTPSFDDAMSFILAQIFDDTTSATDFLCNQPYTCSLPVVRGPALLGEEATLATRQLTLTQTYFATLAYASMWQPGPYRDLYEKAGVFAGVTSLSYNTYSMSASRFAGIIRDVFFSTEWDETTSDDTNKMFAFTQLAWSVMYQRNFEWFSVPHCNKTNLHAATTVYAASEYFPNSPCFWSASSIVSACRLPASLMRAIASMGPLLVGGKPYFPILAADAIINTTMINYDNSRLYIGWFESVVGGIWLVDNVQYGLDATTYQPITLRYPATGFVFSPVTPNAVISGKTVAGMYGANMSLSQVFWGTYYTNQYPVALGPDRWVPISKEKLGVVLAGLMRIYGKVTTVDHPLGQNYWFGNYRITTYSSAEPCFCSTWEDVVDAIIYSYNSVASTHEVYTYRPLFVELNNSLVNPINRVQIDQNSSDNSQYQQLLLAAKQNGTEGYSAAANKILNTSVDGYNADILSPSMPSYTSVRKYMGDIIRASLASEIGRTAYSHLREQSKAIIGRTIRSGAQSVLIWYFNTMYDQRREL